MNEISGTYGEPGHEAISPLTLLNDIDQRLHPVQPKRIGRRPFLFGLASLAVDLGWHEKQAIDDGWADTETTFHTLEDTYAAGSYDELWIALGGLGQAENRDKAEYLQQWGRLPRTQPIGYIDYSNQGYEISDLVEVAQPFVSKFRPKSLSILGDSLGGPTGWMLAAELGVPIGRFIHISSPFGIHSATDGAKAVWIEKYVPEMLVDGSGTFGKYVGDPAIDFISNYDTQVRQNGFWSIIDNIRGATQGVMNGSCPVLYEKQVALLAKKVDLPGLTPKLAALMIAGKTEAAYCASEDPDSDRTVKVAESADEYSNWLINDFQVRLDRVRIPMRGHAPMPGAVKAAAPWIHKTNPRSQRT